MASTFDRPPINDKIVDSSSNLTDVWHTWFATFTDSLLGYMTQYGITFPPLTTVQRDSIISPQNGQTIQNTTTGEPQVFNNGAWKNLLHS